MSREEIGLPFILLIRPSFDAIVRLLIFAEILIGIQYRPCW